jgi:DNA-binding XRE family transcriptional regulator
MGFVPLGSLTTGPFPVPLHAEQFMATVPDPPHDGQGTGRAPPTPRLPEPLQMAHGPVRRPLPRQLRQFPDLTWLPQPMPSHASAAASPVPSTVLRDREHGDGLGWLTITSLRVGGPLRRLADRDLEACCWGTVRRCQPRESAYDTRKLSTKGITNEVPCQAAPATRARRLNPQVTTWILLDTVILLRRSEVRRPPKTPESKNATLTHHASSQHRCQAPMNLDNRRFLKELGQRIRTYRRERQWTQAELGRRCRLHRTFIGSVERGERNLSILGLRTIAVVLRVRLAELVEDGQV